VGCSEGSYCEKQGPWFATGLAHAQCGFEGNKSGPRLQGTLPLKQLSQEARIWANNAAAAPSLHQRRLHGEVESPHEVGQGKGPGAGHTLVAVQEGSTSTTSDPFNKLRWGEESRWGQGMLQEDQGACGSYGG
jgi:hypothetical protein